MRVLVHPDVIAAAKVVIDALTDAEKNLPTGYHLTETIAIAIDDQPVARIVWQDDAWCLDATPENPSPDACARCGRTPATGFAYIDDDRYCHGDDDPNPTCYVQASRDDKETQ